MGEGKANYMKAASFFICYFQKRINGYHAIIIAISVGYVPIVLYQLKQKILERDVKRKESINE
jgi:hypothetical protein